jgi:GDP/UDP-N,N'-diacetylbacillosamine 2-epimerase (hydrolysing)
MKKICVITGSRAEYWLFKPLIDKILESKKLKLQLVVTGTHLSKYYGLTYKEIQKNKHKIDKKIPIITNSDTKFDICQSVSKGVHKFADVYKNLSPDMILILGDRYEIFAAASAAMLTQVPIAHIHGGELTQGAIDDSIRHCITKMSHVHFVAHPIYKKRVIQLGEQPNMVHNVGGLGVDAIKNVKILKKQELEKKLKIRFNHKNLMVVFHPVTLELENSEIQLKNLLSVLKSLKNTNLFFTFSNADTNNLIINKLILDFNKTNNNSYVFKSLGHVNFFSILNYVDGLIGNSSSGLLEMPSFKKATIDIGNRQKGRLKAASVIECDPQKEYIKKAIEKIYTNEFQNSLQNVVNPYGNGGASNKIITILEELELDNILQKKFYDYNN